MTIVVRLAKFPPHQDEGMRSSPNLLIRGKVVPLNGDVVVERRQNQRIACLSLMPREESDMARQKQSEPSLGLDRRQLLASAAALSVTNIPDVEAAEVSNSGQAVTVAETVVVPKRV